MSCPDIQLLPQLCRILGISTDELLTGSRDEVRLVPVEERKSVDELTLRVRVNSAEGDKVRVNLPMPLVKLAIEMGIEVAPQMNGLEAAKNIDMNRIMDLVEKGVVGKLVEVESSEGDIVEVVVE